MKKKFLAIVTAALIGTTAFAATASAASGTIDVISREDGSGTRGAFSNCSESKKNRVMKKST